LELHFCRIKIIVNRVSPIVQNITFVSLNFEQEAQLLLGWGLPHWFSLTLNVIQGR